MAASEAVDLETPNPVITTTDEPYTPLPIAQHAQSTIEEGEITSL